MSTMRASVSGSGIPMLPILRRPTSGFTCVTGEVSLMPNPSMTRAPVRVSKRSSTSGAIGAEPERQTFRLRTSARSMPG